MKPILHDTTRLWESDWVWRLLTVAGFSYVMGWIGFIVGVGFLLFAYIWDARVVSDDAPCAKCSHRKDDHHGNCQACLRDELQGVLARDVPCSRFARGTRDMHDEMKNP